MCLIPKVQKLGTILSGDSDFEHKYMNSGFRSGHQIALLIMSPGMTKICFQKASCAQQFHSIIT